MTRAAIELDVIERSDKLVTWTSQHLGSSGTISPPHRSLRCLTPIFGEGFGDRSKNRDFVSRSPGLLARPLEYPLGGPPGKRLARGLQVPKEFVFTEKKRKRLHHGFQLIKPRIFAIIDQHGHRNLY